MEPQSATLSLAWSCTQRAASSTSATSDVSNSATVTSRLLRFSNSSDLANSKPVVVSSDSGIFTDRSVSATEQSGDIQVSRSSSVQSVDRVDSGIDRPDSAVRCSSSNADRPSSALARGVQIVEYPRWNPKPLVSSSEESLVLMEEYLCPRKLVSDVLLVLLVRPLWSVSFLVMNTFRRHHSLAWVQPSADILTCIGVLC